MTIRANAGTGVVNVLAADTVLYEQPAGAGRYHVGAANVFNTTVASIVLQVYISPDLTSASGDLVFEGPIGTLSEVDINAIVGQGYTNLNIIGVGAATGLNLSTTVTEYSAEDV